ncbi:O-antigen translocase [Marinobacter sp.]|jgi:PST family polysaccharide transporter|uniref:O-antigen translocase n=1 Tax=Marinobacter sp. TaxID=50741 RepID=UPI000C8F4B9B|nr:O-antigen translocase [Marinobacter sp.]MAK50896.1 O-antigen flippase [Marinobacter sp.]|tara:strand:- start:2760 stop:4019 length:1260 start_codon:yes stop_codon:yes gene_type:complete
MTLIKTSLLNGIAVVIRMLTLLGLNKVLAIYVGPAGYAAIGQFQNAVQMITTFASGAINNGVTKYTAEYYENEEQQRRVWRTAGTIALCGSAITGVVIAAFNEQLASWFLNDRSLGGVFLWFAATLVLFVFNTLCLAILNGKKEIHRYVIANIAGSLFALAITTVMAIQFGLYGALVSLAIYQSLTFFVTLFLTWRAKWFRLSYLVGPVDTQVAKNLAKYTAMALTAAACLPVSHILIRNHLGTTLGWDAAGYWEAMWRLSAAYLMLVTTTLSVYYLPRLSEIDNPLDLKKEILQGYKIILPFAAACGLVVYLLRDLVIRILFTEEFAAMDRLFGWQMLGNTLKIGSWILAYVMLGKAMTRMFILTEVVFSGLFVVSVIFYTHFFGLVGVSIAYASNYAIYWLVMIFMIRGYMGKEMQV